MTSFMKSVAAAMMDPMQQKPYKESSVKPLMIYLRKLAGGDFDNLDFLMNKKAIDEKLGAYAESTQRTIVFSINNVAKAMKREDIVKLYGKDVVAATKHRNPVGEKTEKQKENWITWEQVIAARDALKEKNTEEAERQYVALSLYTMAPPRRNRDYLEMDVVSRMNKKKTDRNLLVMNKKSMRFVFNQFKTADVYGQQVVKVPKDLEAVLRRYLAMHTEQLGPLFGTGLNSNYMTNLLNSALGKNVGSSMLRHVFVSHFTTPEDKAIIEKMFATADAMAHSMTTQQGVYRKD